MATPVKRDESTQATRELKRFRVTLIIQAETDTDVLHQVTNILDVNKETYALGAIVSEAEDLALVGRDEDDD